MVLLAAAVARAHPELAAGLDGPVVTSAPALVNGWARGLNAGLKMNFGMSHYGGQEPSSITVWTVVDYSVFLHKAFAKANRHRDGLGLQLLQVLDQMGGFCPMFAPADVFMRCTYCMWFDCMEEKEYRNELETACEGDPEELENARGPDAFISDMDGMPAEGIKLNVAKNGHYRRPKLKAARFRREALGTRCGWTKKLLAAMADCMQFVENKPTKVWELDNQGEWEQASATFLARWSPEDKMGHWLDLALEQSWNDGMGTDATVLFPMPDPRCTSPAELQFEYDKLVRVIEGCSGHIAVMSRLFGVIAEAR